MTEAGNDGGIGKRLDVFYMLLRSDLNGHKSLHVCGLGTEKTNNSRTLLFRIHIEWFNIKVHRYLEIKPTFQ